MTTALVVIFVALQILDAVTTRLGQKASPTIVEGNMRLVALREKLRPFTNARWAWLVIAKVIAIAIVVGFHYLGWWDLRWRGLPAFAVLIVLDSFYAVIVVSNYNLYRDARR